MQGRQIIVNCFESGLLGVNCYVVADESTKKAFIVDPGGHNSIMVNHCKDNFFDVEYIVLTHGHFDHIAGVEDCRNEFPKAKLIACIHEKAMLENAKLNMSQMALGFPVELNADHYVTDSEKMKVGNMSLTFLHTPGHTPGGMSIVTQNASENAGQLVVFSGDTLFQQSVGRTDFPGSSFEDMKCSIKNKLYSLPNETIVYPGHMGSTSIGFEKENNPFV